MNATVASFAAPDPRQKRRMGVAVFAAGWGLALALREAKAVFPNDESAA